MCRTVSAPRLVRRAAIHAGLYRVHQFTKVEMFAFCTPDQSESLHLELLRIEESIFQGLGIPYQVIDTCTGDLGGPAYRKYDLEAWMPGRGERGEYGEVTSTSNCTDFQARRLNIRYKTPGQKEPSLRTRSMAPPWLSRARLSPYSRIISKPMDRRDPARLASLGGQGCHRSPVAWSRSANSVGFGP